LSDFSVYARSPERDRQIKRARSTAESARRRIDECIERRQRLDEMAATIARLRTTLFESTPRAREHVHTPTPLPVRTEPSQRTRDADELPA
jgi:hypothetical protein